MREGNSTDWSGMDAMHQHPELAIMHSRHGKTCIDGGGAIWAGNSWSATTAMPAAQPDKSESASASKFSCLEDSGLTGGKPKKA